MFLNHCKIAWRNITRHKVYSTINVLGLAMGICACIIIYLITSFECSFDTFHPDKERIYRILGDVVESTGGKTHFGKLPLPVSRTARQELSGLDAVAGISPYMAKVTIPGGDKTDRQAKDFDLPMARTTGIADPSWFSIFQYDWLAGDPVTALNNPFTLVLTESRARLYFGEGPLDKMLGRVVVYDDSLRVSVSGIVKDWDKNTDLTFTDFISSATIRSSF